MKALIRWTVLAVRHVDGVLILDFMYCLVLTFLRFLRITDWAADWAADWGTLLGTVLAQGANGSPLRGVTLSTAYYCTCRISSFCAHSSDVIQDTMFYLSKQGRSLFG
jgi:hypothetical protein